MKRLVIYFHYDPHGRIDTACRMAVDAMRRQAQTLLFVTNGTLTPDARVWVRQTGAKLLERENTGYDVGAYKAGLAALGREAVEAHDELILMNFTLAGPVTPLDAMFAKTDARADLAFWGLTCHYAMKSRRFGGKVPTHLQSHFLAVRRPMLASDAFWDYWRALPLPRSYEESVAGHEAKFTAHFAALGYPWGTAADQRDLQGVFVNPVMACPAELIRDRGCPFFKRRSFYTPYADELRRTDGAAARELYDFLKNETDYPVDLLVASLLRTQPLSALAQNLHWRAALPVRPAPLADGEAARLLAQGNLCLLRWQPEPPSNTAAGRYLQKAAQTAQGMLPEIAARFAADPMLGVVSPAVPAWPALRTHRAAQWARDFKAVRAALPDVPLDPRVPPPVPCAGWAVVRREALPPDTADLAADADAWKLPLWAQQRGFSCLSVETPAQAAARADMLDVCTDTLGDPARLARQLARLARRRVKK